MKKVSTQKKGDLFPNQQKQSLLPQGQKYGDGDGLSATSKVKMATRFMNGMLEGAKNSKIEFFKEEAKQKAAMWIPINNPDRFKNLNLEWDQKKKTGQKQNKCVLMDHLKSKYDEINDFVIRDGSDAVQLQLSNFSEKDSDSDEDSINQSGYVSTIQKESESTNWLDLVESQALPTSQVMEDYKNDVMLPQVFGLSND